MDKKGEETNRLLGKCQDQVDLLIKSSGDQALDLQTLNKVLEIKSAKSATGTVRQQTHNIVSDAVIQARSGLAEQITQLSTKTEETINTLGERLS